MKATLRGSVSGLVRRWTRIYTCGLPPSSRERRRAEIESDLWEAQRDAAPTRALLARLLLGIPADLAWRIEAGATTPRFYAATLALITLVLVAGWWLLAGLDTRELPSPAGPRMRFMSTPPPPPADALAEQG